MVKLPPDLLCQCSLEAAWLTLMTTCFVLFLTIMLIILDTNNSGIPCSDELRNISAFPGESDYETGSDVYNFEFARIKPAFIAFPRSAKDVQRCLKCSKDNGVPCVVKSGGHSSMGYSTIASPGFVIHLGRMNSVVVQGDMAIIQAGALWTDIYKEIRAKDYLITGGVCPTVGVGGFTLGGGQSLLSRLYGLACDNVVSMVMVTANGSNIVQANESVNSELFWALRGGGGGNFGIVTEFLFTLHRQPSERYVKMSLRFEKCDAILKKVFALFGELEPALADGITGMPYLSLINTSIEFNLDLFYYNSLHNDLVSTLAPITNLSKEIQYKHYDSYYDFIDSVDLHFSNKPVLMTGCFLSAFDEDVAEVFLRSPFLEECSINFNHLGGAVRAYDKTDTAYFYRDATFLYFISCKYEKNKNFALFGDSLRESLEERGYCLGYYVNDIYCVSNWQEKYYGGNYRQLTFVKERWNSANSSFFHFYQEIGYARNSKKLRSKICENHLPIWLTYK